MPCSTGSFQPRDRAQVSSLSRRAAQLASIRQMSGQVSRGSAGEYQAEERAGVPFLLILLMTAWMALERE